MSLQECRLFSSAKNGRHKHKTDDKKMIASVQRRPHGPRLFLGSKAHLRRLNGDAHLLLTYRRLNRRKHIKNTIMNLYAWVKPTHVGVGLAWV